LYIILTHPASAIPIRDGRSYLTAHGTQIAIISRDSAAGHLTRLSPRDASALCFPSSMNHARTAVRIAIVATSYPSHPLDPTGHFVRAESLALVEQGHDVHIIAPAGPEGLLSNDEGLTSWPITHAGAFGWPGAMSRLREKPWRLFGAAAFAALASDRLRRLRPTRIIAHWMIPCAIPIASFSRITERVDVVSHGADVRFLLSLPAPVRERIVGNVLSLASSIRFAAHATYAALAHSLPAELQTRLHAKAVVALPTLNVPDVSLEAKRLRQQLGSSPLAVTVSRLVASKRVDLAIAAARHVRPPFRLGVLGDGPEREKLSRLPGAEHAIFQGFLPRNQALAWIAAADVLIHASTTEAAPTAIREARQCRIPVVACDAGDVALWAQRDHGIVVVPPSPSAIASAVNQLIA
jgi:glycosyltransferase involved in cell wall biosynthesis